MRLRRLVAPVLLGLALALISGCADSVSPSARAWERASSMTYPGADTQGLLVASDGLGATVFAPDAPVDTTNGRSTFAHVPGE